eukprot:jgi/Bigna1/75403/fgenesh1_pg.34_\
MNEKVRDNIEKAHGGDPETIHLVGYSAGGHIASLLALAGGNETRGLRSIVLNYPALDLVGGLRFPFSMKALGVVRGMPLMQWFFQNLVMRRDPRLLECRGDGDDDCAAARVRSWSTIQIVSARAKENSGTAKSGPGKASETRPRVKDEEKKKECNGSDIRKGKVALPPMLVLGGLRDSITPHRTMADFCDMIPLMGEAASATMHKATATTMQPSRRTHWERSAGRGATGLDASAAAAAAATQPVLVSIPGAEHAFDMHLTPTTLCAMEGITNWLELHSSTV